jgi:hypothetical protein
MRTVYSPALGRKLKMKMTAAAMRTIDKCGGVDHYLFRMKPEIIGRRGMELREEVMKAQREIKLARQAEAEAEEKAAAAVEEDRLKVSLVVFAASFSERERGTDDDWSGWFRLLRPLHDSRCSSEREWALLS